MHQRPRKKISPVLVAVLILLAIMLLVLSAAAVFINSKLNLIDYNDGSLSAGETEKAVQSAAEEMAEEPEETEELAIDIENTEAVETPPPVAEGEVQEEKNILNVLILGTDERTVDYSDNARADSILILSLNLSDYSAKLVSLERGMGVPILEGVYEGYYDWLTHCFRYGGAELMMKEVQECFKVDVDHYVRVNFTAVRNIVDTLGGIDIELTAAEVQYFWDGAGWYDLDVGMNHLNGEQALAYARLREIDSDWYRIQRQRRVIQACVNQVRSADLSMLNDLCNTILPMIQTNFTKMEIIKLMPQALNFVGVTFDQMTIPQQGTYGHMSGLGGRFLYAVDFETNSKILKDFLYGTDES